MPNVTINVDADFDGDLAALTAKTPGRSGPPCGVAVAVARIREAHPDRADRVVELIDSDVSAAEVAVFLSKHAGRTIKTAVIRYHRRRATVSGCSCP